MGLADPQGPAIELREISKRYGEVTALSGFGLRVPYGATYGILGPNGAGKTTAIRVLLRIIAPDTGSVSLFGGPVSQKALDRIGYLPEERGLYRRMRVQRLLTFLAQLKGMSTRDSAPRIDEWLERLDLTDLRDTRIHVISKGHQQKIQFISATLHDTEIVIIYERFTGPEVINHQVLRAM